ncbi:MAG: VacJ family lipoprotein [Gammaproteobacteria bacterium]|nr:VacJ family lipoprotein [Gammaproteobacteria bacterium]
MSGVCSSRSPATLIALLLTSILCGCASVPEAQRADYDPWEALNRPIYSVNTAIDKVTLKPLAKGYEKVLPRPVRTGITNFMKNLVTPRSAVNNFLQGKPASGFSELGRFMINSTVGIGGLIDAAAAGGIEAQIEDFGQTAAVWGIPAGPYVVLPFLGPQTLRHAVLAPIDIASDLLYHYDNTSVRDKLYILRMIELRARFLTADKLLDDSKDPYITLRESYLQNREYRIYDGNPPEDDEFFDEFLDEEYDE